MGWNHLLDEDTINNKKVVIEYSGKIKALIKEYTKLLGYLIKEEDKICRYFLKQMAVELEGEAFNVSLDEKLGKLSASNIQGTILITFIKEEDFNKTNNYFRNLNMEYMQQTCKEIKSERGTSKLNGYFKVTMNFGEFRTRYICLAASYPLGKQFCLGEENKEENVCASILLECLENEKYYPRKFYLGKAYLGGCFGWLLDINGKLSCMRVGYISTAEYYQFEYNRLLKNITLQKQFVEQLSLKSTSICAFNQFEEKNHFEQKDCVEELGKCNTICELLKKLI